MPSNQERLTIEVNPDSKTTKIEIGKQPISSFTDMVEYVVGDYNEQLPRLTPPQINKLFKDLNRVCRKYTETIW